MRKVTDKTLADFAGLTPIKAARLDKYDRVANNNKFWHGSVFELNHRYYFVRHWGRNGSKGQCQIEVGERYEAINALADLEVKKRDDGYKNDPSLLEKLAREVVE